VGLQAVVLLNLVALSCSYNEQCCCEAWTAGCGAVVPWGAVLLLIFASFSAVELYCYVLLLEVHIGAFEGPGLQAVLKLNLRMLLRGWNFMLWCC
jgi:hypothetical protein